ncbi:hypothetical protein AKJ40_04660 [candidate division MSBL1 archaeon SCGC-AAA259M10]|uniref:Integrase catalytic domain-containing protein n=2 Tax=candidate division MSBL1 TaxID=215777 RepID=A0A656YWC6_9EURY|nr:hypothetical protein AKJ39_02045 [candidate division MSBL1 archaeon SCGC-AAA259J03]KXA98575.1 hypothetical protein AKJ40_04660 [candidate division MSBL1 archaeon SCGC-AAA259M10]
MNAIDKKTKYNLNTKFIQSRTNENFDEYFKELKNVIGEQVREIYEKEKQKPPEDRNLVTFVTDKLDQYKNAFENHFTHMADFDFGVPIAQSEYGLEHNNNPIERHNGDIKQRYKVMRNFKSYETAAAFLNLRRTIYNHVRPHQSLGHTPGEEAGIDLDLAKNRLLDLIETCATQQ